ncbi:CDP-glycerol glycerophosphotransferase family protein [Flexivirga alba]|uniref:CDP-glycerol glycerophosphotransferase family protein n=1 Tax=Flexivirga alba TaxID=702742 RepID=A0ABW2AFH7_9MICO
MSGGRLQFSVVVPLFRTEKYLAELLDCFDAQRPGDYDLEFVFVDDGSDDASGDIARAWLARAPYSGQVIRQDNGGVSRARNTGITAATGNWITFPDSDDLLSDNYFDEAAKAVGGAGSDAVLLSANVWSYDEGSGARRDNHHLRHKFRGNTATVDLQQQPTFIQTQAASAFFRLDIIREHDIAFVDGLRVAEDAVFTATYLLHAPNTVVAPLRKSIYYYRRRRDATSANDLTTTNPDFYFGRFDRGYVPLLELAQAQGDVPTWLEYLVLYDLSWYLPREMERDRKATHLTRDEKAHAVRLLQEVLHRISEPAVIGYRLTRISAEVRALLLTLGGYALPDAGLIRVSERGENVSEVCYFYQGDLPTESVESGGAPVTPIAVKSRTLDYLGQQLLHERILRLPKLSDARLILDGQAHPLTVADDDPAAPDTSDVPTWKRIANRFAAEVVCFTFAPIKAPTAVEQAAALRRQRYRTALRTLARTPRFAKKFADAWLVMDRLDSAHDNGEYLYDYLRSERPDINAWFVIKKDTPEWERLRERGFRLVAFRSLEHQVALQNAAVVASSQLDMEASQPIAPDLYPRNTRPWRFVYLQHGVLHQDLSHWFNGKDIDLLTTAGVDERSTIVADGSSYKLTTDDVVLTGFPRHDAVVKASERHPYDERSVLLIAPTWRNSLFLRKAPFAARRKLRTPLSQTDYGRAWMGLLQAPALQRLTDEQHAQIVYLPHPEFRGNTPDLDFPDHITVLDQAPDMPELLARARVVVTDYSSIAFDAALAGSRIVYFQFDQDAYASGTSHTQVATEWDYGMDGFGPVTTEPADVIRLIAEAYGDKWPAVYQDRIRRTLPVTDGKAAERITRLIESKFGR